jgi:NAD(P)H-dependent flavin oxidoreductase YrpB (nitropropane dioxygenase family)
MGGGVGSPELAAAVTEAGGLGMLSSAFPLPVADQLAAFHARTGGPVGVGFFAFELPARRADLETAAEQGQVVDLFWGEPDPQVVSWVHDAGALAFWQVGSRDEAVAARDAGCDVVVAQGVEAGGHVRGTTPLLVLLEQVLGAVEVPVVAAGGIATSARLQEVLAAGACAARVGTRFLATTESAAHPSYLAALLAATADDTELTTAYGDGWPDAPHRVLRSGVRAAHDLPEDAVVTTEYGAARWPVSRWSPQPPSVWCSGPVHAMALYAGSGVGEVTSVASVRDVVEMLLPSA